MSRRDVILGMRQVLIKRRDVLRRVLAGDLSLVRESTPDGARAPNSLQADVISQLAEVESRELARIEYALERIQDGQYGICENCGNNIPVARLHALPYAISCIGCQRKAERESVVPSPTT